MCHQNPQSLWLCTKSTTTVAITAVFIVCSWYDVIITSPQRIEWDSGGGYKERLESTRSLEELIDGHVVFFHCVDKRIDLTEML